MEGNHHLFTLHSNFISSYPYVCANFISIRPVVGGALFSHLPTHRLLTLKLDTPKEWLVTPIVAPYDLDNIKLDDLGKERVLFAQFELEHLIIEGNCYDTTGSMMTPPRGLELVLGTHARPHQQVWEHFY